MQNFIIYKNIKIGFSSEGKGSAVVLLHGFLENSTMWNDVKAELSKKNRVITIDLLGHGNSDCLGYIHTMEENAEVIKSVLKHLKIRRVSLVGHSMGGYVALAFAEKYPENVRKICLMNSTSQEDDDERKKLRLRAIEMAKTNYESLVKMSVGNLFARDVYKLYADEISQAKSEALKTSVQAYIACCEGMILRPNREYILTSSDYEKLIIIGKNDPVLSSQKSIEEAKRTNTNFVEFSNGHMSHIENKDKLILTLKKFL